MHFQFLQQRHFITKNVAIFVVSSFIVFILFIFTFWSSSGHLVRKFSNGHDQLPEGTGYIFLCLQGTIFCCSFVRCMARALAQLYPYYSPSLRLRGSFGQWLPASVCIRCVFLEPHAPLGFSSCGICASSHDRPYMTILFVVEGS